MRTGLSLLPGKNKVFTGSKLRQVKAGLLLSILMLFVVFYAVFSVNKKNNSISLKVAHSARVLLNIEEIYSRINELESAQRGYLLTGNKVFVELSTELSSKVKASIASLKELVKSDHVQLNNALQLELLINEKIRQNASVEMLKKRSNLLMSNMLVTRILYKMGIMKDVETMRMNKRFETSRDWSDRSTTVVMFSLMLAVGLISVAFIIIIKEYTVKLKVEKKLLEYQQRLKEKIEWLNESNKELEQFAYVASHDLQEPLRKIITFNDRINSKLTPEVSAELKDYLNRTSNAALRMRILIEDLLSYSKVSRSDMAKSVIRIDEVLTIIKDDYEVTIQTRNVRFIHHDKMPEISGDKTQMIQLFQNLISNAIKFTNQGKSPVIEFFCEVVGAGELKNESIEPKHEEYYKISVKDNGIGFSEKYLEKIFIIFQRLHGRSQYEGTGIGLSICKKIMENHEGYIQGSSVPDEGSVFRVFFPRIRMYAEEQLNLTLSE